MNVKLEDISLAEIKRINEMIEDRYGYSFHNYALSSYKRRIARFMLVEKLYDINQLVDCIGTDRKTFNHFLREITVNTTEMFRSPSMWNKLREEVLPNLEYKKNIRIWHAGCSSGEEVYSLAITLHELNLLERAVITATDINNEVMEQARKGEYAMRNMELNQSNYLAAGGQSKLQDYYSISDDGMKAIMDENLITNVKFYSHDLVKDGVFGKFDLILCRNVLIYFDKSLQDRVYSLMMESLNPLGYLIIGSRESMVWSSTSDRYRVVSDKERIFQIKE